MRRRSPVLPCSSRAMRSDTCSGAILCSQVSRWVGMTMIANCSNVSGRSLGNMLGTRTAQTTTRPTTPINSPAICCSSAFHAPRHPFVLPNDSWHASGLWLLSGNGQAMSFGFAKPQQLYWSWIALIELESLALNSDCHCRRKPQSSSEGGAACVPSSVITTVE